MKSVWKWILIGLAVFLLAFCIALPLFSRGVMVSERAVYSRGMMPFGGMPHGMMGVGALGWLGMLARLAIPVLFIVLIAALVVALVRKSSTPPAPPAASCSKCGKPVQQGWVACPYCGEKL
jgi:uncharacterized membrane protein YagU involved in acid resistance